MDKRKCRRCGAPVNENNRIPHNGLVDNDALWVANSAQWCIPCQKEFLRLMGDYNDKYWENIEVQDGQEWERREFRHLSKKHGMRLRPGGSFEFPISGHMPRKLRRR